MEWWRNLVKLIFKDTTLAGCQFNTCVKDVALHVGSILSDEENRTVFELCGFGLDCAQIRSFVFYSRRSRLFVYLLMESGLSLGEARAEVALLGNRICGEDLNGVVEEVLENRKKPSRRVCLNLR
jgi:hypothetical protein